MPKGILDIEEVLALKEVNKDEIECLDGYFKVKVSSLERFSELVNSRLIRSANGITRMQVRKRDLDTRDRIGLNGAIFFAGGEITLSGSEEQRLTYDGEPLGVAFTDGGVEYLSAIIDYSNSGSAGYRESLASYRCGLIVPSTGFELEYDRPVEDKNVLGVIRNVALINRIRKGTKR